MLRIGKPFAAIMVVALIAGTAMMAFRRGWIYWKRPTPGKIIFINGTSSSGKTTVIQRMQEQSDLPWMTVGLDTFLFSIPRKLLHREPKDGNVFRRDVIRHEGKETLAAVWSWEAKEMLDSMPTTAEMLAKRGLNIILDELLIWDERLTDYLSSLKDLDVFFVGIRPPIETSEEWEKRRGDRPLGLARHQYEEVHKNKIYDFEVNPTGQDPDDVARQILDAWKNRSGQSAFDKMRKMRA